MLVCPQCQFENPDENRFCQQCGTSLTDKSCQSCGETVELDVERCQHCGAMTGSIFRAVLLPKLPVSPPSDTTAGSAEAAIAPPTPPATSYLDSEQRYRPLESIPSMQDAGVEVRVIDCKPYAPSPLEVLFSQMDADGSLDARDGVLKIPAIAQTYLELEQQLYPSVPAIRDAWEQNGQTVVLLEDRSTLSPLLDLWEDSELPPFQMLHLLHQMIELWSALESYQSTQSLLEIGNLRVDEDQLLYLQRLYSDRPDAPPQLADLGQVWQHLFQAQASRHDVSLLVELASDLEAGQIETCEAVRSRLEILADKLQPMDTLTPEPEPTEVTPTSLPLGEGVSSPDADENLSSTPAPQTMPPGGSSLFGSPDADDLDDLDETSGDGDDVPTIVLPMKLISLEDAGRSDIGRQRDHNEDNFSIQTDVKKSEGLNGRTLQARGLYILCDGMGGHAGGEVASSVAVSTLKQFFQSHWQDQLPTEDVIRQGILEANKALYDINQQDDRAGSARMGTTLVLVLVQNTQAAIAHVGDSRLYRFSRRQGLQQITVDHEVGQREIQRGVEPAIAYARIDAYQLTQALGPRDANFVVPDVQFLELNEDLLLLLCSDGLSDNNLLETHCSKYVEPLLNSQTNLEHGVNELIDLANQVNGHDNITAIAIRIRVRPNLEQMRYE